MEYRKCRPGFFLKEKHGDREVLGVTGTQSILPSCRKEAPIRL